MSTNHREYSVSNDLERRTPMYDDKAQNLYYKISMIEVILWPNISA